MKIRTFKVERWMNEFEERAAYNLAETCIDSLRVEELLELCGRDKRDFYDELMKTRLTYGHIFGSPELLRGVAGLYQKAGTENVVPTHGAIGANNMAITTMIERGDSMVSVMPTYQQHYSIPESIGAEVRILHLRPENDFLPDVEELASLVDENTKMITINNPDNPSGSWIPTEKMEEIVAIARKAWAYVISDEVYRVLSEDGSYMTSIVDIYEKGVSVGSTSKIFSLAGLRLGWIVTRDLDLIHQLHERRDYDTISCGVIDDMLAAMALANKEKIYARNKDILFKNRAILDRWVNETPGVRYVRPTAGTTALVYYDKEMPSYELCQKLLEEKGVLFTPGACFELEGCVRIGYAFDSKLLAQGLEKFAEFLQEI